MTSTLFPDPTVSRTGSKQHFTELFELEHATTMRLLRSYPEDALDLEPHERCNSARDLAWTVVLGQQLLAKALTDGFDWSSPPSSPPSPPDSLDAIIEAVESSYAHAADIVRETPDEHLSETIQFFVAPETLGDVPKIDFMWMVLRDQIHHRGQLSIYLRMAGGSLPSIYGPTADEPWT